MRVYRPARMAFDHPGGCFLFCLPVFQHRDKHIIVGYKAVSDDEACLLCNRSAFSLHTAAEVCEPFAAVFEIARAGDAGTAAFS